MKGGSNPSANVVNGDHCMVVSGTHAGKSGVVRDRKTSATGHVTITVEQADGSGSRRSRGTFRRSPEPSEWMKLR